LAKDQSLPMNCFISSVIEGSYRFSQKWDSAKPLPEFIGTMPLLFADLNLLTSAPTMDLIIQTRSELKGLKN